MTNCSSIILASLASILQVSIANAQRHQMTFVCGSNYSDASENCKVNPSCPTGAGCPLEKYTCFAIPQSQCSSPPTEPPTTAAPSRSPIPAPFRVCGSDYDDALINCRKNWQCPTGDMNVCPSGNACFSIPVYLCPTDAPSVSPTPAPKPKKVCGTNSFEAQANCPNTRKGCPTGDGCAIGEACFNVPADLCGATQRPSVKPSPLNLKRDAALVAMNAPPIELYKVCGVVYEDARENCRMNPICPTGDVSVALSSLNAIIMHRFCCLCSCADQY